MWILKERMRSQNGGSDSTDTERETHNGEWERLFSTIKMMCTGLDYIGNCCSILCNRMYFTKQAKSVTCTATARLGCENIRIRWWWWSYKTIELWWCHEME